MGERIALDPFRAKEAQYFARGIDSTVPTPNCLRKRRGRTTMKMLGEYLERALEFETLAHTEQDEVFKDELLKQALAYRKLAAKRAKQYGLSLPPDTNPPA